ncbi:MAG: hypothetical protein ACO1RT_05035, partial [Planctomycetaceae bacterium]
MPLPLHETDAAMLVTQMAAIGRCVIAYSGGVDSAVVAAAAVRADRIRLDAAAVGDGASRSVPVTSDSPSVSREQL